MTQPPVPQRPESEPPPPGIAERLVAQSGFVAYETGTDIFDEPVLVYAARPAGFWPDFDVYDHVGRPRGFARSERSMPGAPVVRATYYDAGMSELLAVRSRSRFTNITFDVTGIADCKVFGRGTAELAFMANNEHYGTISGSRLGGLTSSSLRILDHRGVKVGTIRSFTEGLLFNRVTHYVVSIDQGPSRPGSELRRMLVVAPTMIALVASGAS